MLFLFRQIRQALMQNNKISKYMFYALGEIVLVVIGILIAVSLDKANQRRKENIRAKAYLERLNEELGIMITESLSGIDYNEEQLLGAMTTIDVLEKARINQDQKVPFENYLTRMHQYTITLQDSKSYKEMLSSGEFGLIKNRWIRDQLQEIDDRRVFLMEVGGSFHRQALSQFELIRPHVQYQLSYPGTDSSRVHLRYDLKSMSKDQPMINMISQQSTLWADILNIHKVYLDRLEILQDSVAKEILLN